MYLSPNCVTVISISCYSGNINTNITCEKKYLALTFRRYGLMKEGRIGCFSFWIRIPKKASSNISQLKKTHCTDLK